MHVRPASPADTHALVGLLAAQLAEHGVVHGSGMLEAAVRGAFAEPSRGRFLVADEDGRAVGVAYLSFGWSLEHGGRSAWLEELYVEPDRREMGTGTELLRSALAVARDAGCLGVDLEVDSGHARAAALYGRHGFRALERRRYTLRP
jgi:GNAT superfamily N-acetyltransferase